jgi:hypothetical protein
LQYSSPQSISVSAAEGKQDGTFIASKLFAPNLEWSPDEESCWQPCSWQSTLSAAHVYFDKAIFLSSAIQVKNPADLCGQ